MIVGTKEIQAVPKALTISDAEWDLIQKQMLVPESFAREDIRVYDSRLAHNFPDRSKERFPKATLDTFAKTIVGKSVLFDGHVWGGPGQAIWFDASLEQSDKKSVVDHIGYVPNKNFLKRLDQVIERDGGLFFLRPKFYTLAVNPATKEIDAGLRKWMSIGFKMPALVEVREKSGLFLWKEYQNTADEEGEAVEGSFVFLGDQPGAQAARRKQFSFNSGGKSFMQITVKSLNLSLTVDPENEQSVKAAIDLIESKVADAVAAGQVAADNLKSFKALFGEGDVDIAMAKTKLDALKVLAETHRKSLVEEVIKLGCGCKMIAIDGVDAKKKELDAMSLDQLEVWKTTYQKLWSERNPQASLITDPAGFVPPKEDVEHGDAVKSVPVPSGIGY